MTWRPARPDPSVVGEGLCLWSAGFVKDELLHTALHGTAVRYAAERRNLDEFIQELCQLADGGNDILAEATGITAGAWYAWPSTHIGHQLIAAGMLIMAGGGNGTPLDYDELERGGHGLALSGGRGHAMANGERRCG